MRYASQVKPISYLKAKAVLQDVAAGKVKPVADVVARLRAKHLSAR